MNISTIDGKPFKGTINNWREIKDELSKKWYERDGMPSLGYYIVGDFLDHPEFAGQSGCTSMVVKQEGAWVETFNSVYYLAEAYPDDRHLVHL